MKKIILATSNPREIERYKELRVTLTLIGEFGEIEDLKILCNRYGEEASVVKSLYLNEKGKDSSEYETIVTFSEVGKYDFHFSLKINGEMKTIKCNRNDLDGILVNSYDDYPYWSILVFNPGCKIPEWLNNKVFYQIFVDRFKHSPSRHLPKVEGRNYRSWNDMPNWKRNEYGDFHNNDFFGGDLNGITAKLPYLKAIGIDVLYLSPINFSLLRYDRYASTNHFKIDSDAGNFSDLEELCTEAHKMDMKVILDIALNHCNSDNTIFKEALEDPNSPYRDWFLFDSFNNYQYWFGLFPDMPIFNQNSKGLQEYMYGENGIIAEFSRYVDGFRLDVAEELKGFFLEGIKKRANINKTTVIYGEYWHPPHISLLGKCIDGFTNYSFSDAILKYLVFANCNNFKSKILGLINTLPQSSINMSLNSLDTHDTMRVLTLLAPKYIDLLRSGDNDFIWDIDKVMSRWHTRPDGRINFNTDEFRKFEYNNHTLDEYQYKEAKKRLKIAAIIQFFLPGNPCIYYGTEAGMTGFKDPFNRTCYPWGLEDDDLIAFYSRISSVRKNFDISNATFELIHIDSNILIFKRENAKNKVIIAVNRTDVNMDISQHTKKIANEKTDYIFFNSSNNTNLTPFGALIMNNKKEQ